MRGAHPCLILIAALWLGSCGGPCCPPAPGPTQATLHADAGGPYRIIHNVEVTFSGTKSTATVSPIARYSWNCGQEAQRAACIQEGPTPVFIYRKCGVSGRPECDAPDQKTYTVTLTITNTQGTSSIATTTVTVMNSY